jgi:hypothetical protein
MSVQTTFVFATQNENLVWQKVKNYLSADNAVASVQGSNPAAQGAFLDLKAYLSQQKRNLNLQFVPFAAEDLGNVDGITMSVAGACTMYGLYARSRSTWATASFLNVHDAATTDASTTTIVTHKFSAVKQSFAYVNGIGWPFVTQILLAGTTAVGGDTASTVGDLPDGFVILGA